MRMTEGDVPVKKTLTHILLLALVLALSLGTCAFAEEAEETAAVSTPAYIFWQDTDWWPAAWLEEDDYWTPTPAMVTGEGWYTVKLDAHMPSWFYSGGNSNIGAQKLAIIIKDGQDLFPGLYMQVTDIRVDGVSYPCGAVTYGQTGYDNINDQEGGKVYWDANDTYGLIWDQWMIDNGGSIETGTTWNSAGEAQKFDVFDVSVLHNPKSIEIDFFLSAEQDVKPEGGPALRVKGEGPTLHGGVFSATDLIVTPENATTASLYYQANGWWPVIDGVLGSSNDVTIKGEGEYTVRAAFSDQGGWVPSGNGALKLWLVVEDGSKGQGTIMDDKYLGISDVRVNGTSINMAGTAGFGGTGYDSEWNTDAEGNMIFTSTDGYSVLFDDYVSASGDLPWGHETWDGSEGTSAVINPDDLKNVNNIEVDFFVTGTQGELPPAPSYDYKWYPNNTMGVAGYSLRDMGITDKWYNVVPVNLTENGIYKIPLVVSNLYTIGNAIVTVDGDNVTVDYETQWASPGNLTINSECVKWFDSIDDVTAEFCADPQSDLAFGEPMNKSELGNIGYLFICNGVTYCNPIADNGIFLARYNHYHVIWEAYRANLDAMVAELEPIVVESPDAEAIESPDAEAIESPDAGAIESPDAGAIESPDSGAIESPEAGDVE